MTRPPLPPQPIPLRDGQWWIGTRMIWRQCERCHFAVYYRPLLKREPGVWLVRFICPICSFNPLSPMPEPLLNRIFAKSRPFVHLKADTGAIYDQPSLEQGRCKIPGSLRGIVYLRDGYTCQEPGCSSRDDLTIDHIEPVSKGGRNELSNFRTLCRTCNSRKGARV